MAISSLLVDFHNHRSDQGGLARHGQHFPARIQRQHEAVAVHIRVRGDQALLLHERILGVVKGEYRHKALILLPSDEDLRALGVGNDRITKGRILCGSK